MDYTNSTIPMFLRFPRYRPKPCSALALALFLTLARGAGAQRPIKPLHELSASALTLRDSVVAVARAQVGRRYVMGGTSPKRGFDCSGLVKYVLRSLEIDVPRTAIDQSKTGWSVARDTSVLRPGDLLLFGKARDGVSHVGIYVGSGRYIHASSVAGRVIESPLNRPPSSMIKVLKSVRRVLAFTDSVPVRFNGSTGGAANSPLAIVSARLPQ
jgi:cell wall-associated NlpC family hydrolase